jgi:hypothetical protein
MVLWSGSGAERWAAEPLAAKALQNRQLWEPDGAPAAYAVLAVFAAWFLAPTLGTFLRPDFEPAPKDDISVLRAQQPGMVDGGQ